MERRLAAIMAADVVGYSRLIRADEEGTITALKGLRADLIDPKIAEHHGRIVKLMGDGMLAEFASVVDAVRAAVETQLAVTEYNSGLPEDKRIKFRVGINLGDVVIDGDDIHGDGVNVAARLEGMAEPGGICVSGMVYEGVRDRIDIPFEDLGEQEVKNIDRPVRVWRWTGDPSATVRAPESESGSLLLPDRPSIAVLSFDNLSGDPEQEYFSDGICEDVITELSRYPGLFVIARNSSFVYKRQATDVKRIARELGVRYVLEGSVRRGGDRVRVTAQLIDGTAGHHLWAERYDRPFSDIFAVQDEIVRLVVGTVAAHLVESDTQRALRAKPNDLDAYDHMLRSVAYFHRNTKADNAKGQEEARDAIALDPDFSSAHAFLAGNLTQSTYNGWSDDPMATLTLAREHGLTAVTLDDNGPAGHAILGVTELWLQNHDQAIVECQRAVDLAPSSAIARMSLSAALNYAGRPEEGLTAAETAMRLDPHYSPTVLMTKARALYMLGRYEESIRTLERLMRAAPEFTIGRALLAGALVQLGRIDHAKREIDAILEVSPTYTLGYVSKVTPFKNREDLDRFLDGLRKAGLPE